MNYTTKNFDGIADYIEKVSKKTKFMRSYARSYYVFDTKAEKFRLVARECNMLIAKACSWYGFYASSRDFVLFSVETWESRAGNPSYEISAVCTRSKVEGHRYLATALDDEIRKGELKLCRLRSSRGFRKEYKDFVELLKMETKAEIKWHSAFEFYKKSNSQYFMDFFIYLVSAYSMPQRVRKGKVFMLGVYRDSRNAMGGSAYGCSIKPAYEDGGESFGEWSKMYEMYIETNQPPRWTHKTWEIKL